MTDNTQLPPDEKPRRPVKIEVQSFARVPGSHVLLRHGNDIRIYPESQWPGGNVPPLTFAMRDTDFEMLLKPVDHSEIIHRHTDSFAEALQLALWGSGVIEPGAAVSPRARNKVQQAAATIAAQIVQQIERGR